MKKSTFITGCMIAFSLLSTLPAFAGGGWATCAVSITKDSDPAYNYRLNNEGWTDGTWGLNTDFQGTNFGTPFSLTLNGGSGNGWTDDTPGYTTASFKIYYRAYLTSGTPGTWSQLDLDFQAYHTGNNYIYDKSGANINVLSLVPNVTGAYTLEVVISKNQFYTGGNWNSMEPGGQAVAYSDATAGYTATFNILATGIHQNAIDANITSAHNVITVDAANNSVLEIYSISGQNIDRAIANGRYTKSLKSGAYIVKVNGKAQKVMVK
ncbi:MAG: T9SS type A sorting domain-containing protein [Bacteroidales bacterium]|nr:T9SS type A sorting domain-containing protein [Bacteroidales bacterium]